jgi:hypothetical protein
VRCCSDHCEQDQSATESGDATVAAEESDPVSLAVPANGAAENNSASTSDFAVVGRAFAQAQVR